MIVKNDIDLDWQIKSLIFDFAQKNNLIFEGRVNHMVPVDKISSLGELVQLVNRPKELAKSRIYLHTLQDYHQALQPSASYYSNWSIKVKHSQLFAYIQKNLEPRYQQQLKEIYGVIGTFTQCIHGIIQYNKDRDFAIDFFQSAYDSIHSQNYRTMNEEKKLLLKIGKLFDTSPSEDEKLKNVYLNYLQTNHKMYTERTHRGKYQFQLYEIITERFGTNPEYEQYLKEFNPYIHERKYEEKHIAFADYNEHTLMVHINNGYIYDNFKYNPDLKIDKLTYYHRFEMALDNFFNNADICEKYNLIGFSNIYSNRMGDTNGDYNHYLIIQKDTPEKYDVAFFEEFILNCYRYLDMNHEILFDQSKHENVLKNALEKLFIKQKLEVNIEENTNNIFASSSPKI